MENPLLNDKFVDFLLYDVHEAEALLALEAFADHGRETFDLYLAGVRRFARQVLFPSYPQMDREPPTLVDGRVRTSPALAEHYAALAAMGCGAAERPVEVGGQALPSLVAQMGAAYLSAGNLSSYALAGLTAGAAELIEAFGEPWLKDTFMRPMYDGRFSGTMALTEPQAGSSLGEVECLATPTEAGHYLLRGAKIFISGGDHTAAENVVHLALARIEGAPAGTRGISLFVVPRERLEGDAWVSNDVAVTGLIHKIGWRGLPSVALAFGDQGDCHGYLVGAPHAGLRCMFQMMNSARIMIGMCAAATASVGYHEAVAYAQTRLQGRALAGGPGIVPIVQHPDVRRMLLRQKHIVDGSLSLIAQVALYTDLAHAAPTEPERARAKQLLDLLTPIAKTYPAERGFEVNALAVQVLGGYGYTSEYLPEAFMRDQKLNTIHEGTTGIQSLDLLGRKALGDGGASLKVFAEEVLEEARRAREADVPGVYVEAVVAAVGRVAEVTAGLGARGARGDTLGMLGHSVDYLEMFSLVVLGWQWLKLSRASRERSARRGGADALAEGLGAAAQYFFHTELPRLEHFARLCHSAEDSFLRMEAEWFAP